METWQQRIQRECSEVAAAIRAALALSDEDQLTEAIERAQVMPRFSNFTWQWAPALAQRNRVRFRPFILSAFDSLALDARGATLSPWKDAGSRGPLEALLADADARDDVELTRRLYRWRHESTGTDEGWKRDLVARFTAAGTPAARNVALAKVDLGEWPPLDPKTALALWTTDRGAAKAFILGHIPHDATRAAWKPLLDRARSEDVDTYFALYRKVIASAEWIADVKTLPGGPTISAELEKRHPTRPMQGIAGTFYVLLDKHGAAAVPYVQRHVATMRPGWAYGGQKTDKGVADLIALASKQHWSSLWAALLRTSASRDMFDKEVKRLVSIEDRLGLALLAGHGIEVHSAGASWSLTHTLTDDTASKLYEAYPGMVRGPYRIHITPNYQEQFAGLARKAIARGDDDLVDYLAARGILAQNSAPKLNEVLVANYKALAPAVYVTRAARVLSRIPAQAIWSYQHLLQFSPLAQLLFTQHTERFLDDGAAVRDLLESPQLHVQLLGFRILGARDPRAIGIAARSVDLLQAALLRKLRSGSRVLALAALRNAVRHDEATARYVLERVREAMQLPDKRMPREEFAGVIGEALHRWPALRTAREQPVIYREARA